MSSFKCSSFIKRLSTNLQIKKKGTNLIHRAHLIDEPILTSLDHSSTLHMSVNKNHEDRYQCLSLSLDRLLSLLHNNQQNDNWLLANLTEK